MIINAENFDEFCENENPFEYFSRLISLTIRIWPELVRSLYAQGLQ